MTAKMNTKMGFSSWVKFCNASANFCVKITGSYRLWLPR